MKLLCYDLLSFRDLLLLALAFWLCFPGSDFQALFPEFVSTSRMLARAGRCWAKAVSTVPICNRE